LIRFLKPIFFGLRAALSCLVGWPHGCAMEKQRMPQQIALVVDDSMLIRHTVCRFLEQRGFSVVSATNGVEAMQILSNVLPDLIVTDLMMPKMTGSELISAVRSHSRMARIPVVVLAGRRSASEMKPEGRADYVIFKDIDIEEQLTKALSLVLGQNTPVAGD
jgi:CheY-like chemotaxis protein